MSEGKLEKVVIQAFKDKKRRNQKVDEFTLPINPENYSRNLKIKHDNSQAPGKGGNDPKFKATESEQLKLDFTFDNSGTVQGNHLDGTPIPTQIKDFLKVVYQIESEKHDPLFLKISWGSFFVFDCKLSDVSINYTLFNPSGEPLRAKLSATFLQYCEKTEQTRKDDKRSPDLTKVRQVKEGDSFPLMTYNIYNSNDFYLQVAKANNLTSFRKLNAGQELIFPPIEKAN